MNVLAKFGSRSLEWLEELGAFWRFTWQAHVSVATGLTRWGSWRLVLAQMFEVGTRSLPVVMITGMFVGMVLAVQAVTQFKNAGLEGQLGIVVNLSVLRELGPVLTAVLLAGRVGGAMTAELGSMRVTEQIDALRAMGAAPSEYLVAPRFLACVLLGPVLVIYADMMGFFGGYYVSVLMYNVNASEYWAQSATAIESFDVLTGLVKAVVFAGSIALIACHKAFRCRPGAAGVGRACTEAFVASCMVILAVDFFLNVLLDSLYQALFGARQIFG